MWSLPQFHFSIFPFFFSVYGTAIWLPLPWMSTPRCFFFQRHAIPSNQLAPKPSDLTQVSRPRSLPWPSDWSVPLQYSGLSLDCYCPVLVCISHPCLNPTLMLSGYFVSLSKLLNIIKIMNDLLPFTIILQISRS